MDIMNPDIEMFAGLAWAFRLPLRSGLSKGPGPQGGLCHPERPWGVKDLWARIGWVGVQRGGETPAGFKLGCWGSLGSPHSPTR
jgi:hypothetical protein